MAVAQRQTTREGARGRRRRGRERGRGRGRERGDRENMAVLENDNEEPARVELGTERANSGGYASVSVDWTKKLASRLLWGTCNKTASEFTEVVSQETVMTLLDIVHEQFKKEAVVIDVSPKSDDTKVVVVGDTHGQFHDALQGDAHFKI